MATESKTCRQTAAVFSRGIRRIANLPAFLDSDAVVFRPGTAAASKVSMVVGWGFKPTAKLAEEYARRHQLPYLRLEDGFLRSVGLGVEGEPALSMIVDDVGMYYDATAPSRLENLLNGGGGENDALADESLVQRARVCIERIVAARLSKYNNSVPGAFAGGRPDDRPRVLVIDQTAGDVSISKGMVPPGGFSQMLRAALDENPDARIFVKTHPDVLAGKKKGYLTGLLADERIEIIAAPVNPIELISRMDRVYTATSQLGFEALMVGKPVTCFGMPFYAGWGLTDDRQSVPRRQRQRTLEELFAAAYILYPRYLDPETGQRCEIERVIEYLELQRAQFERNRGQFFCLGFSVLKRGYVRRYLASPGNEIHFVGGAGAARRRGFGPDSTLVVWGFKDQNRRGIDRLLGETGGARWRMEDGFIRSTGLGSDLNAPASLVVDSRGIYFDPGSPSDLETILETHQFEDAQLERARALRERILASRVSKYNLAAGDRIALSENLDRKVILVPGQVENDASIQRGCVDIRTNEALLAEVRQARPEAFIIFKSHPDVVSGNRKGRVPPAREAQLADLVVEDATIADCLDVADEVHTMTSQVGFEALLRELEVHVYGRPFYSGWGLTTDRHVVDRRTRNLSLDQLVAGTLLSYPRYLDSNTWRFSTPEAVVSRLERELVASRAGLSAMAPWPVRQLKKLANIWRGIVYVR